MGATTRHPDDPLPMAEAFRRAYPVVPVAITWTGLYAIQAGNGRGWRPACWHRPVDAWWAGDAPLGPPPVEERWPTYGPATARRVV